MPPNQNPEQIARDTIDAQLRASGWTVQDKAAINSHAGEGQAVHEYAADKGCADYGTLKRGEGLRRSILKNAFSGCVVPRDPAHPLASARIAHLSVEHTTTIGSKLK